MTNEESESISNPSEVSSNYSEWLYYGLFYGNLNRVIVVFTACLFSLIPVSLLWQGNIFHQRCEVHLELAASASSIEIALKQLTEVMAGCKSYQTSSTQEFWQRNLSQELRNLQQVNPAATVKEKYFTLQQFREVMKSTRQSIGKHGI